MGLQQRDDLTLHLKRQLCGQVQSLLLRLWNKSHGTLYNHLNETSSARNLYFSTGQYKTRTADWV